ncbi:hypothetical protein ACO22_05444 [Paracoccidioides brasiliensis]|nr:hypothetical protein ACO22_05444 [Paracoccidioides brasiliensis]
MEGQVPSTGSSSSIRVAPVKVLALGPPRTGSNFDTRRSLIPVMSSSWIRLSQSNAAQEHEGNLGIDDPQKLAARELRYKILSAFFNGDFINNGRSAFRAQFNKIRELVPKQQLLIYDIKEGWGPLCEFLGKPVPSSPFPGHDQLEIFDEQPGGRCDEKAAKPKLLKSPVDTASETRVEIPG